MANPLREKNVNIDDFRVNPPEGPDPETGPPETVGYAANGSRVDAKSPYCCAKRVTDPGTGNVRYWVKRAMSGPDSPHLFNPNSLLFTQGDELRQQTAAGRGRYQFRRVNQEAFNLYLSFLQTGNLAHFRQAERAID